MLLDLLKNKKITQKTYKQITPDKDCRPGLFYALPKLHKTDLSIRPIISNIKHPTSNISRYIHTVLKPTAEKSKTFIKNSSDLINQLKKIKITRDTLIITADIESLYTNIPNNLGCKLTTAELYKDKSHTTKPKNADTFQTLLNNVLSNNIFTFNEQYFIQTKGTAMGTIMAPTYANTLLKHMEETKLINNPTHRQLINQTHLYKRYIDDILIIFDNKNNILQKLIETLKQTYLPLKLNITYGQTQNFLDLTLTINPKTLKIDTQLYKKPFDNTLLNPTSNHPKHTIQNILTQEIQRIKRLCNNPINCQIQQTKLLKQALIQGYTYKQFRTAQTHEKKEKSNEPTNRLILTYNLQSEQLKKHIKEHLPDTQITYRSEPKLKNILIKANLPKLNKQQQSS